MRGEVFADLRDGVVAVPLPPAVWSGLTVLLTGGVLTARGRVMRWFR